MNINVHIFPLSTISFYLEQQYLIITITKVWLFQWRYVYLCVVCVLSACLCVCLIVYRLNTCMNIRSGCEKRKGQIPLGNREAAMKGEPVYRFYFELVSKTVCRYCTLLLFCSCCRVTFSFFIVFLCILRAYIYVDCECFYT